jgi:hypothetical protein
MKRSKLSEEQIVAEVLNVWVGSWSCQNALAEDRLRLSRSKALDHHR